MISVRRSTIILARRWKSDVRTFRNMLLDCLLP